MQGTLVPKLTLSVRNGPSVSFGTNFPCNDGFQTVIKTQAIIIANYV